MTIYICDKCIGYKYEGQHVLYPITLKRKYMELCEECLLKYYPKSEEAVWVRKNTKNRGR